MFGVTLWGLDMICNFSKQQTDLENTDETTQVSLWMLQLLLKLGELLARENKSIFIQVTSVMFEFVRPGLNAVLYMSRTQFN